MSVKPDPFGTDEEFKAYMDQQENAPAGSADEPQEDPETQPEPESDIPDDHSDDSGEAEYDEPEKNSGEQDFEEDSAEEPLESEDANEEDHENHEYEDVADSDSSEDSESDSDDGSDYKAQLDELFEPMKAAGRDNITVKSVAEARRLMQMGIDYSRKMAGVKQFMKTHKTLESHGINSDESLSFLIDLNKGDPKAIAKLLQTHNIDPIDLDVAGSAGQYQESNHTIPEERLALEEVVNDLKESPTYDQLTETVMGKWDKASQSTLYRDPKKLHVLNTHMNTPAFVGQDITVFDAINQELTRQKTLGMLDNVSDFDAYKQIGSQLFSQSPTGQPDSLKSKTTEKPKASSTANKSRKKAAQLSKPKGRSTGNRTRTAPSIDELVDLSDEAFLEAQSVNKKYL